jgi:tight adherence protein B
MSDVNLIIAVSFVGVFSLILGAYWAFVVVPERRGQGIMRRRLRWEGAAQPAGAITGGRLLKKEQVLSTIASLDTMLKRSANVSGPLKELVDQAGVPLTVGSFLLITIVCVLAGLVAVQWYTRIWWLALIAGGVLGSVPFAVVSQVRKMRIVKFEEQFPEAIQLIARAMRAGHAFSTGLKMAADELPPPCGLEFKALYEQQNYGAPLPDALRAFALRIPSLDARFFVTAVLTQREAGGNLAEVLDRLAGVMRERFRIKREVRVKSAHGRITAFVLAGMPPVLAILMLSTNPAAVRLLTTDPLGLKMIAIGVTLQVVGTLVVRKLVDIQY